MCKGHYSPKIKLDYVERLYAIANGKGVPMTRLANDIIGKWIDDYYGENGLEVKRWYRALELAKILFDDQGYFTDYLDEIAAFIRERGEYGTDDRRTGLRKTANQKIVSVSSDAQRKNPVYQNGKPPAL